MFSLKRFLNQSVRSSFLSIQFNPFVPRFLLPSPHRTLRKSIISWARRTHLFFR